MTFGNELRKEAEKLNRKVMYVTQCKGEKLTLEEARKLCELVKKSLEKEGQEDES